MGAFKTKKTLYGNASQIPAVAEQIRQSFAADGYEVRIDNPANGQEIYITKGGFVKAALGLRSSLKITTISSMKIEMNSRQVDQMSLYILELEKNQ